MLIKLAKTDKQERQGAINMQTVLMIIKNANLALAFFMELGVLVALGYWGFHTGTGTITKIIWALVHRWWQW